MGWGRGRPSESGRAGKTPQAFSATRSLTGLWTGAKTGLPSFSFLAMAPMQQRGDRDDGRGDEAMQKKGKKQS